MLDILRGDEVDIELYLGENDASDGGAFELQGRGSRLLYSAAADEFIDVCARVTNTYRTSLRPSRHSRDSPRMPSASPLRLTLRLELRPPETSRTSPAALAHLARYVVIEGVSPVALPTLNPGQSEEVRISICLLAQGRYELSCVAEEVLPDGLPGAAKKAYSAREPLIVEVNR